MDTIKRALTTATIILKRKNLDSAPLDAEVLLSFCLNKPKEFLHTYPGYQLTKKEKRRFAKLIDCRKKFEPVAYLVGSKEFYGLQFIVNKHVLIPRPLSEQIVDQALDIINNQQPTNNEQQTTICDLGTGSGCLIIALAKKLEEQKIIGHFKLYATDISARALNVAQKNAKIHQVDKRITFLKGDLLKPLKNKQVDLIVANLPYLAKNDVRKEPSIKKEPLKALVGNFYPKLFKQINRLPRRPIIIFEDLAGVHRQ